MKTPRHIAVIMDGNGRWARKQGHARTFGHKHGTKSTVDLVDHCVHLGVEFLTIYVFSSENWNRPESEVSFLVEQLLVQMIDQEMDHLMEKSVRLQAMGDLSKLPAVSRERLQQAIEQTAHNTKMQLNLAISYGGRLEIVHAVQAIAQKIASGELNPMEIGEQTIANHLYLPGVPDPELMIRTGGEQRISNYLLWQAAYSELYFTDTLWPEFSPEHLDDALHYYATRQRRFGKVIEE
jgi:undecaprenyl diphosphate synthase